MTLGVERMGRKFIEHVCVRCGEKVAATIVSKFNTDRICLPCKDDEKLAPGYAEADAAEVEAVRRGDYNFPGVGLTVLDELFLAERRFQRDVSQR